MRLIIIGCEYTGKTTLTAGIREWLVENMGSCQTSFHDHFEWPFLEPSWGSGEDTDRVVEQIRQMDVRLLESFTRYQIHYHTSDSFYGLNDHCPVNWYYADAVYSSIYYGYGRPGEYADRRIQARYYDAIVKHKAPDTVLVWLKASPEVIIQRMRENPHPYHFIKEEDVELILSRFEEEYTNSMLGRKLAFDTTDSTPASTLAEFVAAIEPHLTEKDQRRILTHKALHG